MEKISRNDAETIFPRYFVFEVCNFTLMNLIGRLDNWKPAEYCD